MSVFSKFLQLQNGVPRTVDLSTNTLSLQNLQINGATSGNLTFEASGSTTSYSIIWPSAQGSSSTYLKNDGSGNLSWVTITDGTVTSVALSDGSTTPIYSISGSPVTSSGTLTFSLETQSANLVFAGPTTGSAAQPTFRALVQADLPTVASSNTISNTFTAGQSFSANTSYLVRWGMNALSETTSRIYAADYDTTSYDEFWALGIALSTSAVSAGQNIDVYSFGIYSLGSSDTPFVTSDVGKPVWLTSSGAFSTTAPSASTQADFKIGVVVSTTQMWIDDQLLGVGGASSGAGPEPLPVDSGGTGADSFTAYAPVIGGTTSTGALQSASTGMSNSGYVLTSNGTSSAPTWQAVSGSGTVTSVAFSDASTTPIYDVSGSPVTSSGTLTVTLADQNANIVFAGPASGSAAQPSFRSLVAADIPSLSYANQALSNLSSTSINQDLLPSTDQARSLGSSSKGWLNGYINSLKDASGVNSIRPYNRTLRDGSDVAIIDWGTLSETALIQNKLALNNLTNAGGYLTMYVGGAATTPYTILWPSAQGGSSTYLKNDGFGNLSWATVSGGSGTVTSVALSDGSTTPIYSITGSPVTSSGTLTFSLETQSANLVFAGPTSGSAAQPTFRSLAASDIPDLSSTYVTQTQFGSLYDEIYSVGSTISSGTPVTLPASGTFTGAELQVYLNGQFLMMGSSYDWQSSGSGPTYTALTFADNLYSGDTVHFVKTRAA